METKQGQSFTTSFTDNGSRTGYANGKYKVSDTHVIYRSESVANIQ